jgi:DNA repair protein RadD
VGKSVIIAGFIKYAMQYPNQRILIATHVKELIVQNNDKLKAIWPNAPTGIFSAGLKSRDTFAPITFAGIGTLAKSIEQFGHIDLLLVDEAHLISPNENTQYRDVIKKLMLRNPALKVVGFSATGYRKGQGKLTDDGGIFTDVALDLCTPDNFKMFFANNWLVPPIPKRMNTMIDVTKVGITAGEFNAGQLQAACDVEQTTQKALEEFCSLAWDRKAWLLFCSGIEHAEHTAEILTHMGIPTGCIHSKRKDRSKILEAWIAGELRAVTNNDCLTTGIDFPAIDAIAMLRPTMSTSLWVQMIGRGLRPSEDKHNCIIADFAGNTERLGPIDDPCIPRKPGLKQKGEMPVKICDACGCYNHTRAPVCDYCGAEFTFKNKLNEQASTHELISGEPPIVETFTVDRVIYRRHTSKSSGNAMINVQYYCNMKMFNDYLNFDGGSYGKKLATDWWRRAYPDKFEPATNDEALQYIQYCKKPTQVRVWLNNKPLPKILSVIM